MGVCECVYIRKRIPHTGHDSFPSPPPPSKKSSYWFFLKKKKQQQLNKSEFEVQHKVSDIAGGKEINNKQVKPEYQKWLLGRSAVCFKVPEVPVSLEKNKWKYPFTWFFSANPKRLHPALGPQAKTENVKTEEDVLRLMTRRFSSWKAEKDPFVVEEAE